MAIVPVTNLGSIGIVQDKLAHELPLEAWSAGQNVDFRRNAVCRSLGYESVFSQTPTVDAFWYLPWEDTSNYFWFYLGTQKAYRTTGGATVDVTPTLGNFAAGSFPRWSGGIIGGVPVVNNDGGTDIPHMWNTGTSKFLAMTNWPAGWFTKRLRVYKQYMIAMDMIKAGSNYHTLLHWSAACDPGTADPSWTPSSTNDAGSAPLSEDTTWLVDCKPLGDANVVYKEGSTYSMQHIDGPYVFNFKRKFSEFGMLAANCVQDFDKKHLVVSQGDVVLHNGISAESVIDQRNRKALFNLMSNDYFDRTIMVANHKNNEFWVCLVEQGNPSGYCNLAYVWNYKHNTWSIKELPDVVFIQPGIIDTGSGGTPIDSLSGIIDSYPGVYDQRSYNPALLDLLYAVPGASNFYKGDSGNQFLTTNYTAYVERTGLPLAGRDRHGEPKLDAKRIKFIRAVYPKIKADPGAIIKVYIGSQNVAGGAVTWGTAILFDPSTDLKVDCTVSTKFICVKFESATDHYWEMESYDLDMELGGYF